MARDRIRVSAEEHIRRQFGSRSGRDANRRRLERGARALGRRLRNAGITFVLLLFLLIVGIASGFLGWITAPLALIATLTVTVLVLFWPSSGRSDDTPHIIEATATTRLDRLTAQTEDWLVQRSRFLPHETGPILDRIVVRLRDLEPALAGVPIDGSTAGEAQRLIGKHLPGLVNTYLGLPPTERQPGSDTGRRFAESLVIVADELDKLCERVGCERRISFDTESRFLETRYRDTDHLSLDKRG